MVIIVDLNSVNLVLTNAEIELIKSSFRKFLQQPGSAFEDEFTGENLSLSRFTLAVPVFIGGKVIFDSFLLDSDCSIKILLQTDEILIIAALKFKTIM